MDEFSPYGYEDVEFCIRVAERRQAELHRSEHPHAPWHRPAPPRPRYAEHAMIATQRNFMRCKTLLAWRHARADVAGRRWSARSFVGICSLARPGSHRTAASTSALTSPASSMRTTDRHSAARERTADVVTGFVPDFDAVQSVDRRGVRRLGAARVQGLSPWRTVLHPRQRAVAPHTDLAPLADEITFGVNGIFYMTRQCGFAPTYYVVEDNHVFADDLARVNNVDAVAKFFPSKYRPIIEPDPTSSSSRPTGRSTGARRSGTRRHVLPRRLRVSTPARP